MKAMKIEPPEGSGTPLEEIVWTVPTLHLLINQMLRRSHVSTLQLMESWDANGDGELSRPEVLAQIRPFFRKCLPGIWEYEVKPVAVQAFDDMDGHQRMDGQKVHTCTAYTYNAHGDAQPQTHEMCICMCVHGHMSVHQQVHCRYMCTCTCVSMYEHDFRSWRLCLCLSLSLSLSPCT